MRIISVTSHTSNNPLHVSQIEAPIARFGEVLIDIVGAGVNRADLLQRRGSYPSPAGWPEWPGLECAGIVSAVGDGVSDFHVGDQVCALVGGGA